MAEAPSTPPACPSCGTKYKWSPEVAGRKLRCKCGAIIRMPREPGGAVKIEQAPAEPKAPPPAKPPPPPAAAPKPVPVEPVAPINPVDENADSYDLSLPQDDIESLKHACPSCGKPVKTEAVICLQCGYHLRKGAKIATEFKKAGFFKPTGDSGGGSSGGGSTAVLVLKIFAFIFNAILLALGAMCLLKLNFCGIIIFFSTGMYNVVILIKGRLERAAMIFAIICNALTLLFAVILGIVAIILLSGALEKNSQIKQAIDKANLPPGIFSFLALFFFGLSAVMLLSAATTFATVMLTRRRD